MNTNEKNGLSLIVLVITIIVMLILSGIVIYSLTKNNVVDQAKSATELHDVAIFRSELEVSHTKNAGKIDNYKPSNIYEFGLEDIKKYIPSFTEKYENKYIIAKGDLIEVDGEFVPICTVEQFSKMCSGEKINVKDENGKSLGEFDFTDKKKYILINDLDFTGIDFKQIEHFTGILEGYGHKIINYTKNVAYDSSSETSLKETSGKTAMINAVTPGSEIRNLTFENVNIKGGACVAPLAAMVLGANIDNVKVNGINIDAFLSSGGIAGETDTYLDETTQKEYKTKITNCEVNVYNTNVLNVKNGYVGNIASFVYATDFSNIKINLAGKIKGESIGSIYYGGVTGYAYLSKMKNIEVVNNGTVENSAGFGNVAGAAYSAVIENCYSSGSGEIIAGKTSAGIVGDGRGIDINNCHNTMNITALNNSAAGGIMGYSIASRIRNCTNTGDISAQYGAGGIVGDAYYINELSNCKNTGNISGINGGSGYKFAGIAGGAVGNTQEHPLFWQVAQTYGMDQYNIAKVRNNVTSGNLNVSNKRNAGAIAGTMQDAEITCNVSSMKIHTSGNLTGGINGQIKGSKNKVTNTYYLDETDSLPGRLEGSTRIADKVKFKDRNTFVGLDFKNVWKMDETTGYPTLK